MWRSSEGRRGKGFIFSIFNFISPCNTTVVERREGKKEKGKIGKDSSEEQVSLMKEAYSLFNTNDDGGIAPFELRILMRSYSLFNTNIDSNIDAPISL